MAYPKITKRKDGRFSAMVPIGLDPSTGKQKRKTVYGRTRNDVKKKIRELEEKVITGQLTPRTNTNITLREYASEWYEIYTQSLAPNTRKIYRSMLNTHIIPDLGGIKLSDLTPEMCQQFINRLTTVKELKPRTIRLINSVLYSMLKRACQNGRISSNPASNLRLPRINKPSLHFLSEDEMRLFLKEAKKDPKLNIFRFLLYTGLRISECLALTWDDLTGNELIISKQFSKKGDDYTQYPTKNKKSRTVVLSHIALEILKEIKRDQTEIRLRSGKKFDNPYNLIFTNKEGKRLQYQTIYQRLKKIAGKIGCPDLRVHDLRHSYAVLSLKAGVDPKTLSENLGHSDVAFTLNRYAYVTREMRQESANKLDSLLTDLDD